MCGNPVFCGRRPADSAVKPIGSPVPSRNFHPAGYLHAATSGDPQDLFANPNGIVGSLANSSLSAGDISAMNTALSDAITGVQGMTVPMPT